MCLREESDMKLAALPEYFDTQILEINEKMRSRPGVETNID
jgi:hypothetical protein